ncbi:MAG: hypothetical protein QOD02_2901 [Mycobacterium sp.]|jgi:hypothetical protein|nr:hypothetical protein [Mycobacterium sp.]MDT5229761.1 hypothetical protein [Mycobacterium sp.]MDT5273855.1 hypothetical protein [Mycobacterium sp.]MDT5307107.1 hypothetical protein [Mycobacterium sp.]
MRVSGAARTFLHDNLSIVNVPRRCCRPGCPHYGVATLTFVYSDSTAVIGPLAVAHEPHSWDLCVSHAGRITAPRGWELVRHSGPLATNPDEDDLIALAEAVREGRDVVGGAPPVNGFHDPGGHYGVAPAEAPAAGVLTSASQRPAGTGRRRGHLRVLPDPAD